MAIHESWKLQTGKWEGTNELILPGEPQRISPTNVHIMPIANGTMLDWHYSWTYEGNVQDGHVLLSHVPDDDSVEAVFLDTFHMSAKFMHLKGKINAEGKTVVHGTFAVSEGPDWGWRIEIASPGPNVLLMQMYCIAPGDIDGDLGVDIVLNRIGA